MRAAGFAIASIFLAGAGSASAQVISNVLAAGVTSSSVTITWATNLPASSKVNYGLTTSYNLSSALDPVLTTTHSVTLYGLAANTLYNFNVVSTGSSNTTVSSANFRFATLSLSPIIADINTIWVTSTSVTVNWTTDQPSTGMVNYGPTSNYIFSTPLQSTPSIAHTVTLNGLSPNTTYNFAVVSSRLSDVPSTSANQTVTTAAATATAPSVGFTPAFGVGDASATLTWSTNVPANTVVAYGTTLALGQLAPVQTALSTSHQVVLTGLHAGTTYYFVDMSTGAGGATGYSPLLSFTTTGLASLVPVISNVASSNLSATSATITWNTGVPSTSQVHYGTTASYGFSSPLDSTLTTIHSVNLTGLSPSIRYVFQVVSASTGGVSMFGANMTGIKVWAWGDSLTLGYGDYLSQNTYPLYLSTAIGTPVANEAVGGWTSTQIAQLMLATPASFPVGNCNVIWSGGNNHNQVSQVLSDIASMVAALASPPCFLVLGVIQRATAPVGTPDYNSVYSINTSLAAQYGNNYLDISELLVQDYDPALALDVADYAKDVPPASLRAVQPMGTVTSGALDSVSCRFSVSNGTQGPGTAVIMDAETILVKAVSNNVLITDCTRGYNGTAAASHAANVTYSVIDQIHLGDKGYEFVALQVAAWFEARFPLSFSTPIANTPGPVIDAVTVSSVTSTSALVSWTTDQPATSLVNYGPTASYGLTSTLNPTLTTAHSVALTGLTPNSTYNFSVVSANSLGGSSASANATLTTSIAAAPAISGVTVATLTPTSATITWTTDQPATTEVAYGSTPSYGSISSGDGSLSTSHYLTLFGLTAGTSYNYEAMSTNATGASAVSQNFIFRTGTFPATPRLPVLAVNPAIPANLQITAFATGLNYPNGMYQLPDGSLLVATSNPANNVLYGFATSTLQVYRITTTNGAAGAPTLVFGGSAGPATGMAGVGPLVAIATGSNTGSQILILQADNQDTLTQLGSIVFTYPAGYWQHDTHAVALRGVPNQAGSYQLIFSVGSQANNVATPASAQVGTSGMISQNLAADSLYSVQFSVAGSTIAAAPAIQLANGLRNPFALGFAPNGDIYLGDNGQNIGLTNVATSADTFDVIPAGTTTVLNFGFPDTFPDPVTGLEVGPTTGVTLPLAAFTPLNGQNSPGVAGMALAPTSFPASLRNGVFLGFFGTGYGYGCFWDPVIYLDPLTGQYFHFIEGGQFGVGPLISMLSTESALYIADFGTTGAGGTIYAVNLAPAITSVTATAISTTTATITWTTDQASSTQVSYGTTTAYGSQSALASTPVTSHSVSLTGLTPLTTYNFAVVSTNGSGASSTAGNFTFATAAAPPLISGVTATSIAATSAVITWTTDQASSSQVSYGTTPAYGSQSTLVSALVTSHSVALTGLTPNTTYNYQVISANSSGTSSASTNYTFTTTSTSATPPYVGYLAFWGINNNGVTISWSTDVNSNTVVAYGTTSALGQIYTNTSAGSTSTTSHGAVLTGLTPGTKYYFVAQSTGANGATGYSATFSFTTTGVAVSFAPVISGISVSNITSTSVTITWSTDQPSWSQVNYGTTTNYGSSSPLNTNLVNSHSVTLASLVPGTTYDFDVTSANGSGLLTTSPNQTFSLPPSGQPSFHLSASSATAIAGSPASYIAYGDSITYGAEASSTATRYTNLIASDSSAALTNRGAGGAQACDTAQTIMSNDNPPGSQAPLQTIMIGTNDAYIKGTGSYESVYKSCHTASLAWLAIPSTQKTAAQSCARSGAWEADTTYPPGLAAKSYSPGAALSCSLISYGGPLYLWYRVTDTNVGAFSYSVDGGPAQPVNSFSSTPIATWGGGVDGVFVIRIPGLAAGSHTVQVTVTSSVVSILAVGSLNPLAQFGAPKAFVGGVIRRQYDADAASTAAYDADAVADVVLLSGDGLPVYFVPVRNYVDANTDMFDGLHPADLGHLHLRDAFESVSQFPLNSPASFSSIVTVTPTDGFNSSVTLSASGWPAGITGMFGTNPATGSSTVTISVDASVAPGPYTLTVIGTSGTLSANTTISIVVTAPPSFTLSATAATATTVSPGTSTVTVTPASGFNSAVTLAPSGWPSGIAGTFGTNPATASSTVAITVAASVAPGQYALTVRGTLGTLSASTTIALTVTALPGLGSSANFTGLDTTTQGTWSTKYGGDGYLIANGVNNLPAYASVAFTGASTFTWSGATSDVRALQTSQGSTARIASCYYSTNSHNFSVSVNLTDGADHQVAIYLLDGDMSLRSQTITITDSLSGILLDSRSFTQFNNGSYGVWNIKGNVTINVTANGAGGAVVSAVFFGPAGTSAPPSFTLSAAAAAANVGSTGTSTVTVTPANGFNSGVTLAASGWPSGITGTFGTNPATASTPVTISVGSGVTPGPYTLSVSGTGGALSASTTISLTVSVAQQSSFTLGATAATANVGSTGTSTVTITPANGFNSAVTLSTSGWPAGITGTFGTSPATASSLVTISVGASVATGPYTLTVNGTAGTLTASTTIALAVTALPGLGSSANFTGLDTSTQGTWSAKYGGDGYLIPNGANNLPAYASVAFTGASTYTWAGATSDVRAPQTSPGSTARIAACYYPINSGNFSVSVNLTDGATHQVAIYLLDWDTTARAETITITDALSGILLDSRSFTQFSNGSYGVWNIKGSVTINVTANGAGGAVASAIFFGPAGTSAPPSFTLSAAATTANVGSTGTSTVTITPANGFNSGVTLAASGWPAGITGTFGTNPATASSVVTISVGASVTPGPYTLSVSGTSGALSASTTISLTVSVAQQSSFTLGATAATANVGSTGTSTVTITPANGFNSAVTLAASGWPAGITGTFGTNPATGSSLVTISVGNSVTPGPYTLSVNGTSGALSASTTIALTVTALQGLGSSANFTGLDTTTQGTWSATYGGDGYIIANGANNLPVYASVAFTGASTFTWAGTTSDVRALQTSPGSTARIASCYYSTYSRNFSVSVNLTDGAAHQVAIYLLDGDMSLRSQTITITDALSGILLDSRSFTQFHNGAYGVWNIKGNVTINVTSNGAGSAVASAIFFGPAGTPAPPSFTLSAAAAAANVGSTGTSTVTVTPANGFNSGVTLAASGWPSGITGTFGTNPATASTPVTISVGSGVTPGPYTLSVSGTGGALSASTTISLTVSVAQQSSFTLGATAATANVGSTGTSTVTITPANGFNSAVTLAASGWPEGITGTFGTNPATGSSMVTISVGASVATGLYTLAVNGVSGALTGNTSIALRVNAASSGSSTSARGQIPVGSTQQVYHVGNSLTDLINYDGVQTLATDAGYAHNWGKDAVPGAPLYWIRDHPYDGYSQFPYGMYPIAFTTYKWDAITFEPFNSDADSSIVDIGDNGDRQVIDGWLNTIKPVSPDVQVYIYSRWPVAASSGNTAQSFKTAWERQYYPDQPAYLSTNSITSRAFFEHVAQMVRADNSTIKPPLVIPVGEVMYGINEAIISGEIAGYSSIWDVYGDDIHLNDQVGAYIAGLTVYSSIYFADPRGTVVPAQYRPVDPVLAAKIQDVVWNVVSNYAYSNGTYVANNPTSIPSGSPAPNPPVPAYAPLVP